MHGYLFTTNLRISFVADGCALIELPLAFVQSSERQVFAAEISPKTRKDSDEQLTFDQLDMPKAFANISANGGSREIQLQHWRTGEMHSSA